MAYADDLLRYSREMVRRHPNETHQPSLRRALSSAYYALFHLLIGDAVANCTDPRFRATLARMFDHGPMKNVCENTVDRIINLFHPNPPAEPERTIQFHLYNVAETFSQAQQNRNEADYNLLKEWQPNQVSLLIEGVEEAFKSWYKIREDQAAKDFLISMLPTREKNKRSAVPAKNKSHAPRLPIPRIPKSRLLQTSDRLFLIHHPSPDHRQHRFNPTHLIRRHRKIILR